MRAAIYEGPEMPLAIVTAEDPLPAPDEVVIDVAHCGICGSDLHLASYGWIPEGTILGHEFAGEIAAVGGEVDSEWRVGDKVTALPIHACDDCEACATGLPGLCRSGLIAGTNLETPGGYAQHVRARSAMLQRLPAGISFVDGAMVEPLAVSHHAVELAGGLAGRSVLVLGAGPIGVGVALFARLAGARHVVVSEPSAGRRQHALAVGATHAIDPDGGPLADAFDRIAGQTPSVVFECVGITGLLDQAIRLTGLRGRVVVAGVCFAEDQIRPLDGLMKEASIQFSQCYTEQDFACVIDAIAQGRIDVSPMRTDVIKFDQLPDVFAALGRPTSQCKVLIDPN